MRTYQTEWQLRGSPHSHALDPQHGSIAAAWTRQMAAQLQHRCGPQNGIKCLATKAPCRYGAPGSAEYSSNG